MRTILLAVLASSPALAQTVEPGAPLLLTTGWQAVLEVPDVRAVAVDDPKVVRASDVHAGTVTLLGGAPGSTRLWAYTGAPDAPRVLLYEVVVTRFPTLLPFERVLPLGVDEHKSMPLPPGTRLDVADREVCALKVSPGAVELTGRRSGTTTLIAWLDGKPRYLLISVRGGSVTPSADELDDELTEPVDGRVVLRVGERSVLDAPAGLAFLALKDDRVAAVRPRPGELVFEGLHVGATRVLFWTGSKSTPSSRYVVVLPRVAGDPNPVPLPPPPELQTPGPEPIVVPVESAL